MQPSPTPRLGSMKAPIGSRPERRAVNGLLVEVSVLQHDTGPVLHWLTVGRGGGGKMESTPLATGVAAAATLPTAAKAASRETKGF